MASSEDDRRIRALRSERKVLDPWAAPQALLEYERTEAGDLETALAVFLIGSECPFTCVFCDLWQETIDGPTPPGALPAQLASALESWGPLLSPRSRIKLYNASNFFDVRAVPPEDHEEIARLLDPYEAVTVECHPRLVGPSCWEFADRLTGRLEVAMGLETVHREALARLNKKTTVEDFDRAAEEIRSHDLDVRAFVLAGTPFVPPEDALEWELRSVFHALEQGARFVSLNPVRGGNGEMERLREAGDWRPPTLAQLEQALSGSLEFGRGIVVADLWEAERFLDCEECGRTRLARIDRMNRTGTPLGESPCPACEGEGP